MSCEKSIPSRTAEAQQDESIPEPTYTPLLTDSNVPSDDRPRRPTVSKKSTHLPAKTAEMYRNFIFTSIIVDEFWSVLNDKEDILYANRNIVSILMNELRTDLNRLEGPLQLPHNFSVSRPSQQILLEQICQYLETSALHSEKFAQLVRQEEFVQEKMEKFRLQIKNLVVLSRGQWKFKGDGGQSESWTMIRSDGAESFKGSLSSLCSFLLNSPEVPQNPGKRKPTTSQPNRNKRRKKNSKGDHVKP